VGQDSSCWPVSTGLLLLTSALTERRRIGAQLEAAHNCTDYCSRYAAFIFTSGSQNLDRFGELAVGVSAATSANNTTMKRITGQ
jgi:hypothetical protein